MVRLEPGTALRSVWNDDVTCVVVDERRVEYQGETTTLSAAAKSVLRDMGKEWRAVSGPDSWHYEGKTLNEIREEMGS